MKQKMKITAVFVICLICLAACGKDMSAKDTAAKDTAAAFDLDSIEPYSGRAYIEINDNIPYFTEEELSAESYEYYSSLDVLGRCGVCVANIGKDIMPTEERGEIGSIRPSGWQTVKYNGIVEGNYLYNRCHLIGYQLTGENANERNLITGTRYLNIEGMAGFEHKVADYVNGTGNHVLYRVTPVFDGTDLVAKGVQIEAKSVEDNGEGVLFNVFCYNVQPGIVINYADGSSEPEKAGTEEKPQADGQAISVPPVNMPAAGELATGLDAAEEPITGGDAAEEPITGVPAAEETVTGGEAPDGQGKFAVNGKNGKIHINGACPATGDGSQAMDAPIYFDTYEEAEAMSVQIDAGLEKRKCGNCY